MNPRGMSEPADREVLDGALRLRAPQSASAGTRSSPMLSRSTRNVVCRPSLALRGAAQAPREREPAVSSRIVASPGFHA